MRFVPALLAICGLIGTTVLAQETAPTPAPAATIEKPARGSDMASVRAKFGSPTQEAPAIGQPPITRWEYPGYVVFFEHDKVLHTVVLK
jgi:hypothetical protein